MNSQSLFLGTSSCIAWTFWTCIVGDNSI